MPRLLKQPRKLNCRWCGVSFETDHSQRKHCTDECYAKSHRWRHSKEGQVVILLERERPRPCPGCGIPIVGPSNKVYCSKYCGTKSLKKDEVYDNQKRMENHHKKTTINLLTSPPCSVCSRSTARTGYYKPRKLPLELPEGIELCSNHHVSYARFVRMNSYEDKDPEIIFTTYLVHKTYSSRGMAGSDKDMAVLKGLLKGEDCLVDYQCR